MKNEKALLSSEWESAPELSLSETEEYKFGGYTVTRKLYRAKYTEREDGTTAVTIFEPNGTPLFRSFTGGGQLVSQYYKDRKRSDCRIEKYLTDKCGVYIGIYDIGNRICLESEEQERHLREICGEQADIRKAAVEKRHEKIRKSIKDEMLKIRPLPKKFDKWLDECVMSFSRYIIYTYSGRRLQEGYCTHCRTFVEVEGAKNQKNGKCPNCRSAVKFIASGRASQEFSDEERCTYIQPDKDGNPIFRFFTARWYYNLTRADGKVIYSVRKYIDEESRTFGTSGRNYEYGNFMQTGQYNFCERSYSHAIDERRKVYPYNMKKVFEKAALEHKNLKYIPFVKLLKNTALKAEKLYTNVPGMPSIEYLTKLGLYALAEGAINNRLEKTDIFAPKEKSLKKVFPQGVNRAELKMFGDININTAELKQYYLFGRKIGINKFLDGIKIERSRKVAVDTCFEMLQYMSADKLLKYANEKTEQKNTGEPIWNRTSISYFVRDWLDYLRNAKRLEWNVRDSFVLFPRDFDGAHDRAAKLIKIENAREKDHLIEATEQETNERYGYATKSYLIRAPHNAREIVAEGQALRHCVGTYVDRVAEGKTGILFMRDKKEPQKPLYTIEVRDGELVQVRGKCNCAIKEKTEAAFFKQWKKVKLNKENRKAV